MCLRVWMERRGAARISASDYLQVIATCCAKLPSASIQDTSKLLNARAQAFVKLGRLEEAVADFEALLAMDPLNVSGWANLTGAHIKAARWDEAITAASRSIELGNHAVTIYLMRGSAYGTVGDLEKAAEDLNRVRLCIALLALYYISL